MGIFTEDHVKIGDENIGMSDPLEVEGSEHPQTWIGFDEIPITKAHVDERVDMNRSYGGDDAGVVSQRADRAIDNEQVVSKQTLLSGGEVIAGE
uniref:DUF5709 domain-containing protein n=1 Tax=Heterorhabditis bacteriophora TaxID=37862 RepID=A0A1I7XUX1_HETBA